ncbi:hypothetical protein HYX01_04555 [Candidatus Woesearchaeota archaeon]|nr:hypothetical protein [Candidatus Woesearchaeota archaeon]
MMKTVLSFLALFLVGVLLSSNLAYASHILIDEVKINGNTVEETSTNKILGVERGEELNVRVRITASQIVSNVKKA